MSVYRTKDLADAAEISVQQVRNYEALGLLPPAARSASGYRRYTEQHRTALLLARQLMWSYTSQRAYAIMQALHAGRRAEALALIDAQHAELDRTRSQLEQTLAALRLLAVQASARAPRGGRRVRVGEAARLVGVRVSAVRHWEREGLLHPLRERSSNYRLYDERELQRLQIVVLLRQASYDFPAIRATLAELAVGQPQRVLAAVEQRREELTRRSWACVCSLAALHTYICTYLDD